MCTCVFCKKEIMSVGGKIYLDKYPARESGLYCLVEGKELIVCDNCYEKNKFTVLKNITNLHDFYKEKNK